MHRDAIYCCSGKQDAKSPFSRVHGVRNVQETSSLRPLGKQGQFWCSFAELLLPLGYQPELEGREARIFPFSSVFPVLEIPLIWRSYWGHNSVTMRYENIRDVAFQTYPSRSYSGAKVTSQNSSEMFRRWSFLSLAFFPGSPCQLLSRALQRPQNIPKQRVFTTDSGNFWKLLEPGTRCPRTYLNLPEPLSSRERNWYSMHRSACPGHVRLPLQTAGMARCTRRARATFEKTSAQRGWHHLPPSRSSSIFDDENPFKKTFVLSIWSLQQWKISIMFKSSSNPNFVQT